MNAEIRRNEGQELPRVEISLLLYLECRLVDYRGLVDSSHMNADDFEIAKRWADSQFVILRRRPFKEIHNHCTHTVQFSADAWDIAHKARRLRAERYTQTLTSSAELSPAAAGQ